MVSTRDQLLRRNDKISEQMWRSSDETDWKKFKNQYAYLIQLIISLMEF
jgi:hypothetical protein